MTLPKRGGRPKIPWDASRKRKLARLYLMTNLRIVDIQQMLKSNGFTPGKRNVHEQLSQLFPDSEHRWRQYRPTGTDQGIHRFAQLKTWREHQKRRHDKRIARSHASVMKPIQPIQSDYVLEEVKSGVLYDPLQHYNHQSTENDACIFPGYSQWYSSNAASAGNDPLAGDLEGKCFSNKEVDLSDNVAQKAHVNIADLSIPVAIWGEIETFSQSTNSIDETTVAPEEALAQELPKTDNTPVVSRSSTRASRMSGTSNQGIGNRVSSRVSRSLRHANSLMSATNSWISGLTHMSSTSTGRRSTLSQSTTGNEFVNWDGLEHSPFSDERLHCPEISFQKRPCCQYFAQIPAPGIECSTCGTKEVHYRARSEEDYIIASMDVDKFGNTPLHHAAAVGNLSGIVRFLETYGKVSKTQSFSRNTSGETFMHVLRLSKSEDFDKFLDLLRLVDSHTSTFSFSMIDYHGRTVTRAFLSYAADWMVDADKVCQAQHILEPSDPEIPSFVLRNIEMGKKVRVGDRIMPADAYSETPFLVALRSWTEQLHFRILLQKVRNDFDLHVRDSHGHTPLAVAASLGIYDGVDYLLKRGANPNSRSYRGTSVVAHATTHMWKAQKDGHTALYAKILSCVVLLVDHGATPLATAYDDFFIRRAPAPPPRESKKSIRNTLFGLFLSTGFKKSIDKSKASSKKHRQLPLLETVSEASDAVKSSQSAQNFWAKHSDSLEPSTDLVSKLGDIIWERGGITNVSLHTDHTSSRDDNEQEQYHSPFDLQQRSSTIAPELEAAVTLELDSWRGYDEQFEIGS
ncbi:ankyrin [Mollisia scopiformis]|uniref:Ankyrin n=1 Tax=Mollisia scopiformis TaxID=149040 RepID=A0A194XUI4_MOLSC|nr:ankyrin [Mollisia scopiformis]KUJ23873.1 ankyrin [Mollisia scopiformis]